MDLSKINHGQILSLMQAVVDLIGLGLEHVCHSSLSTWWTKVFDDMGCIPPKLRSLNEDTTSQQPSVYQGGLVIEPKRGLYRNVKVVDVVYLFILQLQY